MKATGIVRRIDDLGRVVIPKEIRRTLHIRDGDPLEIYTEKDGEVIFKKYSPVNELSDFAIKICDALHKSGNSIAVICDRDSIIASAGIAKRELSERRISDELTELMETRKFYRADNGASIPVVTGNDDLCVSVAAPILSEGDIMGAAIFIAKRGSEGPTEIQTTLISTVASFLGKQMEE